MSMCCVALPTCGLALSESERVFGSLWDKLDVLLKEFGLDDEPILFRMTGCPNGCARPYNADISLVGRGAGKYSLYMGGSQKGNRLAGLMLRSVALEDVPSTLRLFLERFAKERDGGETFTDWWGRTCSNGPAPHPTQFHEELEARRAGAGKQAVPAEKG
jgi:sulfite reductase beta subunit-like hemoprotein